MALVLRCFSCGRMMGAQSDPCHLCPETFASTELVAKLLRARDDETIRGNYVYDEDKHEWVKEEALNG